MAKDWYVIHTYAGYEGRVRASLGDRATQVGLQDEMGQVLVPTEDVIEIKDGKRRASKRKFFPIPVNFLKIEGDRHDSKS